MFFIGAGDLDFDRVLSVAAAGLLCRLYAKGTRLARLLWLDGGEKRRPRRRATKIEIDDDDGGI